MRENYNLPAPYLLTYYTNLKDRIVWIEDEILED